MNSKKGRRELIKESDFTTLFIKRIGIGVNLTFCFGVTKTATPKLDTY
jgi:hypothetical protein